MAKKKWWERQTAGNEKQEMLVKQKKTDTSPITRQTAGNEKQEMLQRQKQSSDANARGRAQTSYVNNNNRSSSRNNTYSTSPKGLSQSSRQTSTQRSNRTSYATQYMEAAKKRRDEEERKRLSEARIAQYNNRATDSQRRTLTQSEIGNVGDKVRDHAGNWDDIIGATMKQVAGGKLKEWGKDTNQYAMQRAQIEHSYEMKKISKAERDLQIRRLDASGLGRAYKDYENDASHHFFKKLYDKGVELNTSGDQMFENATKNMGDFEKIAAISANSYLGMAADLAVGSGLGKAASLALKADMKTKRMLTTLANLGTMGGRAYGNALGSTEELGTTEIQNLRNAIFTGTNEGVQELLGGGIGIARKLTGGRGALNKIARRIGRVADDAVMGMSNTTAKNLISDTLKVLGGTAEEMTEELVGWAAQPILQYAAYGSEQLGMQNAETGDMIQSQGQAYLDAINRTAEATGQDPQLVVSSFISNLNSEEFMQNQIAQYVESGMSKADATQMSEIMRDYITAAISGDTETAEALKEQAVGLITKDSPFKMQWDTDELLETLGSTALLTGVTGGASVMSMREQAATIRTELGTEGINKLIDGLIDSEDTNTSARASAIKDNLANGGNLSDTQLYDIAQQFEEQTAQKQDKINAANEIAEKQMRSENIYKGIDKITQRSMMQFAESDVQTATKRIGLQISEEAVEALSETVYNIDSGNIRVDDLNALSAMNEDNRAIYNSILVARGEEALPTAVLRDGSIDVAKTNELTNDYIVRMASNNAVETARIETANWNDVTKGEEQSQILNVLGENGKRTFSEAFDNERMSDNPGKYRLSLVAFKTIYDAVRNGAVTYDQIMKSEDPTLKAVDIGIREAAFSAGMRDRIQSTNGYVGMAAIKGSTIKNPNNTNTVIFDTSPGNSLTASEQSVVLEMRRLTGIPIRVVDTIGGTVDEEGTKHSGANGMFKNGEIVLAADVAPNLSISYTIMHEYTHYLQAVAPEQYNAYRDYIKQAIIDKYGREGYDRMIQEKYDLYVRNDAGKTLETNGKMDEMKVLDEIAADSAGEFMNDENFVRTICNENPTLGRAMLNSIRNVLRKLRSLIAMGGRSERYNNALIAELGVWAEAERLWMDAMSAAMQSQAEAKIDAMERDSIGGYDKQQVTANENKVMDAPTQETYQQKIEKENGSDVKFSAVTWNESLPKTINGSAKPKFTASGRDTLRKTMLDNGYNVFEVENAIGFIDEMEKYLSGTLSTKYINIGWDNLINGTLNIVYETNDDGSYKLDKNGNKIPKSVAVSAMVKNGEYPVNFDFTTICNKREAMMDVINELTKDIDAETGKRVINSIKLNDKNMWKINKALKKEGLDTACLGCFVEARRYNTQKFLDAIEEKWNTRVRKTRKKLGLPVDVFFDFAEGKEPTSEDYMSVDSLWSDYDDFKEEGAKSSPAKRIDVLMNEILKDEDVDSPYLKQISPADILTAEGIAGMNNLSTDKHNLVKMIKSIYGTSAPKEILAFTPYNSEIATLPDTKGSGENKQSMLDYLTSIGGVRVQSFSDFKIENVLDYMQMVADLAARRFPCHAYTKVLSFAQIFGKTGIKINLSVMFDTWSAEKWQNMTGCSKAEAEEYAKQYAGLQYVKEAPKDMPSKKFRDGFLAYLVGDKAQANRVFQEEYEKNIANGMSENEARTAANEAKPFEQSIDYVEASKLENQDGYRENCGIIAVAYSDEHFRMLLDDVNVRYIIPYHKSGLPTFIAKKTNLEKARDFTLAQNTDIAKGGIWYKNDKGERLKNKWEKYLKEHSDSDYPAIDFMKMLYDEGYSYVAKKKTSAEKARLHGTGSFDVYESLHNAKENGKGVQQVANDYIADCISRNQVPVFWEFAGHPNYYKVLFDFAVTDGENIYEQGAVRNEYDESIKSILDEAAKEQDAINALKKKRMPNVMNELYGENEETSLIAGTNINPIRYGTEDVTNPKYAVEEDDSKAFSITPEMDQQYLDAVDRGDIETAQRVVDEAARKAGYAVRAYHGTTGDFTVFDIKKSNDAGAHFADNLETAKHFAIGDKGKVLNVYLKGVPIKIDLDFFSRSPEETADPLEAALETLRDADVLEWGETYNKLLKYAEWGDAAWDEIVENIDFENEDARDINELWNNHTDVREFWELLNDTLMSQDDLLLEYENEVEGGNAYVIFKSSDVKSANPVTYDDNGDVIPLSQRFNSDNDDIRFSVTSEEIDGILKEKFKEYKHDEENLRLAKGALYSLSGAQISINEYIDGLNNDARSRTGRNKPQVRTVAKGITSEFVNEGYVEFRGRKVESPEDVAMMCQPLRDPRFETFRLILTRGNEVVSCTSISSRLPGSTLIKPASQTLEDYYDAVKHRMRRLGADGYYLVHNHPSGNVQQSRADQIVTMRFFQGIGQDGYKGHIILDHNKFGLIEDIPTDYNGEILPKATVLPLQRNAAKENEQLSFDETLAYNPDIPNKHLNKKVFQSTVVAEIGKDIQTSKDYSVIIYVASDGRVREIQEVNNKTLLNNKEFPNYIRNQMIDSGSRAIAIYTEKNDVYQRCKPLIGMNFAMDVVLGFDSERVDPRSARLTGEARPGSDDFWAGKPDDLYRVKVFDSAAETNKYSTVRYSIVSEDDIFTYMAEHPDEFSSDPEQRPSEDKLLEESRQRMESLRKDIAELANYKRKDTVLTKGLVLDQKSVRKSCLELVKNLMQNSEYVTSRGGKAQYSNKVLNFTVDAERKLFKLIQEEKWSDAEQTAFDIARELIESIDIVDDDAFRQYIEVRDFLKSQRIYVPDNIKNDLPKGYAAFRRENQNRMTLTSNPSDYAIDKLWMELQSMYGTMFESEGDDLASMLIAISDRLEALSNYRIAYSSEEACEIIYEVADDLLTIAIDNGKAWQSFADRKKALYDEKTKLLKERHREAIREIQKENTKLKNENKKAQRRNEKLEEKVSDRDEKIQQLKDKHREEKLKEKLKREHRKLYDSISDNYKWLTTRLLSPTKEKNIPEQFRQSLAELLKQIDLQTERSKELEKEYGPVQKTIKMRELRDKLKEISNDADSYDPEKFDYNGYLFNLMDALANKIDGQTIDSIDIEDLADIDTVLTCIRRNFTLYGKTVSMEKAREISAIGNSAIDAMLHKIETAGKRMTHGGDKVFEESLDRLLNEGQETPVYFFERLGGGMYDMYKNLRKGQDKYIRNIDSIKRRIAQITGQYQSKTKHGFKKSGSELEKWRSVRYSFKFNLKSGTITMTPAQMMSLYCHAKREQSLSHICGDGIVVSTIKDARSTEESAMSTMITYDEVMFIISHLTPEQIKMADDLQSLMANEMAELGNETSMQLYGVKLFREKNYFPIKSSNNVTNKSADKGRFDQPEKIRNFGFTKEIVKGARNAIVIDDIFHVVAEHCNSMALYNGFAAPINDFMKVYNYKRNSGNSTVTVQQAIGEAYTDKANEYIMKFIGDVNSSTKVRGDAVDNLIKRYLAKYKKAAIAANIRVLLQQPTAIVRSLMVLDPKYFKGVPFTPKDMQEMFDHCPIALWKSWGNYEMALARDIESQMMNTDFSWSDTIMMGTYGLADNMTWTCIWNACKRKVNAEYPNIVKGTPEYWDKVNEVASNVFDKTQVVDSVLHKSDTMRSQATVTKMSTSFMAEPTLTYNVLRHALVTARDEFRQGNKGSAVKTFNKMAFVLTLNAAAPAAMAAIADALRGKIPGDDDDDEETLNFLQLWYKNFLANFGDNLTIWTQIPFIKDIASMLQGWGTTNIALEGWDALFSGFRQMNDYINGKRTKTFSEICGNIASGIGYLLGYPVKTILRDLDALLSKFGIDIYAYDLAAPEDSEEDDTGKVMKFAFFAKTEALTSNSSGENSEQAESGTESDQSYGNVTNYADGSVRVKVVMSKAEFESMVADHEKKIGDVTGAERNEKIWDVVSEGYTKALEAGDTTTVNYILKEIDALGGDVNSAKEKITSKAKTALKKTIGDENEYNAQQNILSFLREDLGVSDEEISEVVYKSESIANLKAAFMLNDQDAILDEMYILYGAGLQRKDLLKAYDYRWKWNYKEYEGKYKDRMKDLRSTGKYVWPVSGPVTSEFGYRNSPTKGASSYHQAIDIGVPVGTEVGAADGGVVKFAGWYGGYGYQVVIRHDDGSETYYSHLSKINVSKGDAVSQGQTVALSGNTGTSTGPHLDFKVRINGEFVDPAKYLNKKSA